VKTVLLDGSPEWLPRCERALVGAALQSSLEDVVTAAAVCTPEDFRDEHLSIIWSAISRLDECPCWVHVANVLGNQLDDIGGEPELVELAFGQGAYVFANKVGLESHAELVREWGEKRRKFASLGAEARDLFENKITPITPVRIQRKSLFSA
jgi:hypothetical protein